MKAPEGHTMLKDFYAQVKQVLQPYLTGKSKFYKEFLMQTINVTVSKIINAPVSKVYPILADYQNCHPHILPKPFTGLDVEEGGQGAGTVFKATVQVMGQKQSFRMRVTEPEPGRVLAEADLDTGLVTTFTVEPRDADQSRVTIATTFQPKPGLRGLLERIGAPIFLRRIYRMELQQLDEYISYLPLESELTYF